MTSSLTAQLASARTAHLHCEAAQQRRAAQAARTTTRLPLGTRRRFLRRA